MFLLYIVELYQWSNDTATIDELWPNIEKAIAWQIASTADVGIPAHMIDTYDILRESQWVMGWKRGGGGVALTRRVGTR